MKKSHLSLLFFILLITACSGNPEKTIANLKTAIDMESTAVSKYDDFAMQAEKDSLFPIEALFKAVSKARSIHLQNHIAALASLGITDYPSNIAAYDVKSTTENLQAAIDGDTHEFTITYPGFIKDAKEEKAEKAISSFTYAQKADKNHTRIFSYVLGNIKSPAVLAAVYYVCPECGNVFLGTTEKVCDICQTVSDKFIGHSASATLQDATSGATSRRMRE